MWKLLLAPLLLATTAWARENPSAYEALRVVGAQLGRELVSHVISITGVDGNPQPKAWKILLEDHRVNGGVREIEVQDDRVASQRIPNRSIVGSTADATINTARLNLDSTGAYAVASHTAETAHLTYSLVSYTLRTDERGNPVWIVTLENQSTRPLGTIHIRANNGSVTRVEGLYQGQNMEQVADDRTDENEDADENIIKRRIKRVFHKTKEDARRMFERVHRSFVDFFNRR